MLIFIQLFVKTINFMQNLYNRASRLRGNTTLWNQKPHVHSRFRITDSCTVIFKIEEKPNGIDLHISRNRNFTSLCTKTITLPQKPLYRDTLILLEYSRSAKSSLNFVGQAGETVNNPTTGAKKKAREFATKEKASAAIRPSRARGDAPPVRDV